MRTAVYVALAICGSVFLAFWVKQLIGCGRIAIPRPRDCAIGFGALFFDCFGIGAFGILTAVLKLYCKVPDEKIPGTLNVGIALPALAEGFLFMSLIELDSVTLATLIAAASLGALLAADLVSRWSPNRVRIAMGFALSGTAVFLLMSQIHMLPGGGTATGLHGYTLLVAAIVNMVLGALTTIGIGFFAPCMTLVYLLGMSPKAAFPIMMGSVAFLGSISGIRFVASRRYSLRAAVGIALGGVPAVFLAAFLVRSLDLSYLRWLLLTVLLYTATIMFRPVRSGTTREMRKEQE